MREFALPSLGADMDDATLVEWYVQPGQAVRRGELICVVETQKGAIDVEVWTDGTLAVQVARPGQKIPVGQTIALIAEPGDDVETIRGEYSAAAAPAAATRATASIPETRPSAPTREIRPGARLRVSPAARRRAAELGVDLAAVEPAAADGTIALADVERAHAAGPAAPPAAETAAETAAAAPAGTVSRTVADRAGAMRAAISAAMARSKREIPHYYVNNEISIEAAARHLETLNAQRPVERRILLIALQLKALALALREVPQLNGVYSDGRFRASEAIHIGVVTSLRGGGLVVPAVHAVDTLALPELMASLRDTLSRARSGQLRASDLSDGTVTVSNMGDLGADTVWGVIYPPQVAIIGLGRVKARPQVRDGALVIERTLHASVAADHRVSDGLQAARFLQAFADALAQPQSL